MGMDLIKERGTEEGAGRRIWSNIRRDGRVYRGGMVTQRGTPHCLLLKKKNLLLLRRDTIPRIHTRISVYVEVAFEAWCKRMALREFQQLPVPYVSWHE